jgi:glycosyltransferase involved in cell wall biosynthesis
MRVVDVNPIGGIGGAELSLLDLMSSVAETIPGLDRHLIVAGEGPLIARAEVLGVTVHVLPLPEALAALGDSGLGDRGRLARAGTLLVRGMPAGLRVRAYAGRLRGLLRDLDPTVVHSNGIKTHLLLRLSGFDAAPVVWQVPDFYGARPLMARALGWARGGTSRAIAISAAVGRDAEASLKGVPVTVVYNAIDTVRFAPGGGDGARLDRLAGLPAAQEGTIRVGLVATHGRWKGQDLFMRAIGRVRSARRVRFYIVGGPIYRTRGSQFSEAELRVLAGRLGVADRLAFVPFQEDTAGAFRALDVVVHASTRPEPFGRTIFEAMACGRPVVVADAGGASELFTDGVDALGVTPGDPDALAEAMDRLIDDDAERIAIGERARSAALTRFARERLGREIAEVYAEVGARPDGITSPNAVEAGQVVRS